MNAQNLLRSQFPFQLFQIFSQKTIETASTSHESSNLRQELDLWKEHFSQDTMKEDFGNTYNDDDFVVIAIDLQQALPTLRIIMNVVFYFRQVWTYNLCIHNSTRQTYMHIRSEDRLVW
jgi:hypothetical protein